jgi:hypothetical protein
LQTALTTYQRLHSSCHAVVLQGYGLAWSGFREGYLLSGSDDAQICLWDINAANSKMLGAMAIYHQHLGVVEVTAAANVYTMRGFWRHALGMWQLCSIVPHDPWQCEAFRTCVSCQPYVVLPRQAWNELHLKGA